MIRKQYVLLGNHRIGEFEKMNNGIFVTTKNVGSNRPTERYVMRKIRIAFIVSTNRITSIQNGLA